jgi:Rrf2 family protein
MAAMIYMTASLSDTEPVTVNRISSDLGISKIYLEQVFALLKRGGFVHSVKGAQGGYYLSRNPENISVFDILHIVEGALFEGAQERVMDAAPHIDRVIREDILNEVDEVIRDALSRITLAGLAEKAAAEPAHIYYI